ncbi:hypothetical protein R3W88_033863 [Solanum pinnatisectum]|uniref:No apical meristem-associated C-terminal domain-containing protein n=1 Tax=Solanum pinnatisectum TaxID=50273 RepID=A0AAV9K016_9SOLN|nr:hypothetical protein R3W88_033863 [Solanum pinnatisectum]
MSGAGSGRDGQPSYKGGKSSKRKTQTTERQTIQLPPIIPTKFFKSHTSSLQINSSSSRQPNLDANRPQPHNNDVPPIILFDPHKIVSDGIASCIRSKFKLARPSSKKFSKSSHLMWFDELKVKRFINYKATGKDLSILEFYFRTHCKKSDKSWVNEKFEAAYQPNYKLSNRIKKQEILPAQNALDGEGEASQPSQISEMDIWVQSVGGKKEESKNERHKNKKMRKELDLLMKQVYKKSFSVERSSQ